MKRTLTGGSVATATLALLVVALSCATTVVDLGKLSKSPSAVAVVKDTSGTYWAVPVSRVTVDGKTLVVQGDTAVAKGQATGASAATEKRLAGRLVGLLASARSGGFGPTNFSESGTTVTRTVTTTGPDGKPVTSAPETVSEEAPEAISGQLDLLTDSARIEVEKIVLTGDEK